MTFDNFTLKMASSIQLLISRRSLKNSKIDLSIGFWPNQGLSFWKKAVASMIMKDSLILSSKNIMNDDSQNQNVNIHKLDLFYNVDILKKKNKFSFLVFITTQMQLNTNNFFSWNLSFIMILHLNKHTWLKFHCFDCDADRLLLQLLNITHWKIQNLNIEMIKCNIYVCSFEFTIETFFHFQDLAVVVNGIALMCRPVNTSR